MNALIFKKYVELKNSKLRLLSFFSLPFICFFICCYFNMFQEQLATYFILTVSLFSQLIFWNAENMFLSGDLILTPISPKKAWIINSIITSVVYHFYVSICFIISMEIYINIFGLYIPIEIIIYGLLTLIPVIGINLFSSLSSIENTILKQWLASPISLLSFLSFPLFLFFYQFLPNNLYIIIGLNLFGIILIILSLIINKKIENEKVFMSSDKFLLLGGSRVID